MASKKKVFVGEMRKTQLKQLKWVYGFHDAYRRIEILLFENKGIPNFGHKKIRITVEEIK